MAIRQFYAWSSGSYSLEKWLSPYSSASLENPNVKEQTTVRMKKPELQRHKSEIVDPPTREQLQALKEVLGLENGSLQFKSRGAGVYLVTYEDGKHVWRHIGLWIQLREKLGEKISSN